MQKRKKNTKKHFQKRNEKMKNEKMKKWKNWKNKRREFSKNYNVLKKIEK